MNIRRLHVDDFDCSAIDIITALSFSAQVQVESNLVRLCPHLGCDFFRDKNGQSLPHPQIHREDVLKNYRSILSAHNARQRSPL
jgi:hypothetical protein